MKTERLRSLIPFQELEKDAQDQIYHALSLPFLKILAIMPDCHAGYSLPIGGVALLDKVLWPAGVGVDIGCGVCCCVLKDIPAATLESKTLKEKVLKRIVAEIPMGKGIRHSTSKSYQDFKSASGDANLDRLVNANLHSQLGTLGSGNHFLEVGKSREHDCLAVTIHSGSRRIGYDIAEFYMALANEVDKDLPKGFLHLDSPSGQAYFQDLLFAQQFALDNRKAMMVAVLSIILEEYKEAGKDRRYEMRIKQYLEAMINENHNHAVVTPEGVLHRKGATPADEGQLGVIPANMKQGVWITVGLGNPEYLSSASHGAGRAMSRGDAKRKFDLASHQSQMKGIVCNIDNGTIDEDPRSYKKIDRVLELQEGIVVKVIDHLTPLIVAKGSESVERVSIFRCASCGRTLTNKFGETLILHVVDDDLLERLGYPKVRETRKHLIAHAFCGKCHESLRD